MVEDTRRAAQWQEIQIMQAHNGKGALCVRLNGSGEYLMSCGRDKALCLWNPYRALLLMTYLGHGYEVRDVDASHDNSKLVSCGGDRQIFLWDVATGRYIRKFRGHEAHEVNSVKFAGAGDSVVISGGYDKKVNFWDCRSNSAEPIQTINDFHDSVTSITINSCNNNNVNNSNLNSNNNGHEIIVGSVDGTIRSFDIRAGTSSVDDLRESITSVSLSTDGTMLLASLLDSQLALIDKPTGTLVNTYVGHVNQSYKIMSTFLHGDNDNSIASGSEDGKVFLWNVLSHQSLNTNDNSGMCVINRAHDGCVTGITSHPTKSCFVTCSIDSTIKLWQLCL